jgi:hypothetical protein
MTALTVKVAHVPGTLAGASEAAAEANVIALGSIAFARSGDKGNHANLGVAAYTAAGYAYLAQHLTPEVVQACFAGLGLTRVERFELPRIWALNFLLYDALGGGASRSLRIDTQGKLLGTAVLELSLPKPPNLDEMLPPAASSETPA